jgi:hypothetical protein
MISPCAPPCPCDFESLKTVEKRSEGKKAGKGQKRKLEKGLMVKAWFFGYRILHIS